jgi:predicted transcriptional regulator
MNSNEACPDLTAKIISKYVGHHKVAANQLPELIATVHKAIGQLGKPVGTEETRTPSVSIRQSVRRDYVVCLDCGDKGLMIGRHITVRHGLNPDEYRQRWGLKGSHPLTAPGYSEQRSTVAKALGLGRRPANQDTAVKSEAAPAPVEAGQEPATSSPRGRTRPATKRVEAIEHAAAPSKPVGARRSRRVTSQPGQPASPAGGS